MTRPAALSELALTDQALTGWSEASAPARRAGLLLGAGADGQPVVAQVFRRAGTRIVCAAGQSVAELLAVRAAAAGVPVLVRSDDRSRWRAAQQAFGQRILIDARPAPELPSRLDQPVLYIDDLPPESGAAGGGSGGSAGDGRAWQCRLLIREVRTAADAQGLASADLLLLGRLPGDLAAAVGAGLGLGPAAGPTLAALPAGQIALIRARTLRLVTVDPTPPERPALDA